MTRFVLLSAQLGLFMLILSSSPVQASSAANAACTEDGCQACMNSGSCMISMLAQCRDPFCVAFGIGGGLLGAVGGGIVGPMVLTLPSMAMYPGLDPGTAFFMSVMVGAGVGLVLGGLPGMACGSMVGGGWGAQSCMPWSPPSGKSRRFKKTKKNKRFKKPKKHK